MRVGTRRFFSLQQASRQKKFETFMRYFQPRPDDLVMDLGGGNGRYLRSVYPYPERLILVDLKCGTSPGWQQKGLIRGDGLALPFKDGSVDIIWCNAVIEHVGGRRAQQRLADEIRRVGKGYFVATPWRGFPLELHFKVPFYQFVPKVVQRFLSRHMAIGWYPKGKWEYINTLWQHQLQRLFPEARVIRQRVTVWPETLIAFKVPDSCR